MKPYVSQHNDNQKSGATELRQERLLTTRVHHVYKHIRLNHISHKWRHELRRFHLLQSRGKRFGDNPMTAPDRNIFSELMGGEMSASVQNFTFACLAGHKYRKPDIYELVNNRQK